MDQERMFLKCDRVWNELDKVNVLSVERTVTRF